MNKEEAIKKLAKIIEDYCREDQVFDELPEDKRKEKCHEMASFTVRNLATIDVMPPSEMFIIWDALGMYHERDPYLEGVYNVVGHDWYQLAKDNHHDMCPLGEF